MKNYTIFLFCLFISVISYGQNQSNHLKEVEVTAPKFTGIKKEVIAESNGNTISNYVAAHFNYPKNDKINYEGTEVIRFNITPSGKLNNFKVINSVSPKIDNEVIRVLQTTNGMWKPGYNNNNPIIMEKEIALKIKIGETERVALIHDFSVKAAACFTKGTTIFLVKGKARKALKYFDTGILYLPYDKSLHYIRGLCRYELGYTDGARKDWMRLKELGCLDDISSTLAKYNIKDLKGYEEFVTMFLE